MIAKQQTPVDYIGCADLAVVSPISMRGRANDTLLPDDLRERLFAVSSTTVDRSVHSTLVRRQPVRMDYMYAVLSVAAVDGIRIRSWAGALGNFSVAMCLTLHGAPGDTFLTPDHSQRGMEADRTS